MRRVTKALKARPETFSVREAALMVTPIGYLGRKRLYAILRDIKWVDSDNKPYQRYVDAGYLRYELPTIPSTGEVKPATIITAAGLFRLQEKINSDKLIPGITIDFGITRLLSSSTTTCSSCPYKGGLIPKP